MKHDGFCYEVSAKIGITRQELNSLLTLSSEHYDGKCKAASQLGGFLYGTNNYFDMCLDTAQPITCRFSADQVDTMVKILEQNSTPLEADLYWAMKEQLRKMADEFERVNDSKS